MSDCLSYTDLETLALSPGDDAGTSVARHHLASCPVCSAKLDEVRANLAFADRFFQTAEVVSPDIVSDPQDAHGAGLLHAPDIPGYDILEEIHRGAQGIVFKAIQRNTKRTVALKVLLHGPYASRRQKRRFEREIELVAGLDHPNIVTPHDSGVADERHYFAMRYVDGLPLGDYVIASDLSVSETLRLFSTICRTVAYAHQRGIIHRDLKPGNILVDKSGRPHVLDFGLAKPADSVRGADSLATRTGEFFGTLAYASPEHVAGRSEAIDTRTDVYALGVILYELLTGKRPYSTEHSITRTLANITETDPPRPSHHRRALGDEVDTIILKTLAKVPDRRYPSADAVAADIDRYLAGRPIEAKSDSGWYIARKTLIRHKLVATAAICLFGTITAAFVVSTIFWRQAVHDRDRAVIAEKLAATQRDEAQQAHEAARQSLYFNNITLAASALEKNDTAQLKHVLEACPPSLRAWEWHRLWRLADQSLVTFTGHTDDVYPIKFSPDGKCVASAGRDRTVKLWDPITGKEIRGFFGHVGHVLDVAFSSDGRKLATASMAGSARVWDIDSAEQLLRLPHPCGSVTFSTDGQRLLTTQDTREGVTTIKQWDAVTGRLLLTFQANTQSWSRTDYAADGKRILIHCTDLTIEEWDANTGRFLSTHPNHTTGSGYLLYDTRRTVSCDTQNPRALIQIHEAHSRKLVSIVRGHTAKIRSIVVQPAGRLVATSSADGTCKIWDPLSTADPRVWKRRKGFYCAAFSPDGKRIATGRVGLIEIWNASGVAEPLLSFQADIIAVDSIAWSPDGRRMVTASESQDARHHLKLWDAATGRELLALRGHTDGVPVVAFTPDGRRIVSGSWDRTVRVWDADTGEIIHTLTEGGEVWDLAVSPDGKTIASGGARHNVHLWDARTGEHQWALETHTLEIDALAFSPDSTTLVSGANDGKLIGWNVATGSSIWTADTKENKIYDAVYTPDGRRILTSHQAKIKVWDAATGRLVYAWNAHGPESPILSLDLSADGRNLLSAASDGAFKLWPTATVE